MVIKELELFGFKSFAERTVIKFSDKMTAIVGPNGCGKSNILDAIKWVLGERSIRSMRGEKMEDIVFSGMDPKKQNGFARVSLLLDNQSQKLKINTDKVKLTRCFYKDGHADFFINDKKVTLKEIQESLMNTGLGKSCYSFMEQGRMDMILSSRPEERRYIFEEAAGLSKFKAQQIESEKNLENTNMNITRIKDILNDLKKQLQLKSQQAEKTKTYHDLTQKLKMHDLKIKYSSISEMDKKAEKYKFQSLQKKDHKEKVRQRVILIQEKLDNLQKDKEKSQDHIHTKNTNNQIWLEKIKKNQENIKVSDKRRQSLKQEITNFKDQLKIIENNLKDLKKKRDDKNQLTFQLNDQIQDAQHSKKKTEQELEYLQKNIQESSKYMQKCNERQNLVKAELRQLRSKQEKVIRDLLERIKVEKANWEKKSVSKEDLKNTILKEIELLYEEIENMIQWYPSTKKIIGDPKESEKWVQKINQILKKINKKKWKQNIHQLAEMEKSLKNLLFEKEGVYFQKEAIDEKIESLEKELDELSVTQSDLQEKIKNTQDRYSIKLKNSESLWGEINSFQIHKKNLEDQEKDLKDQLDREERQQIYFRKLLTTTEEESIKLNNDQMDMQKEIKTIQIDIQKENDLMKRTRQKIDRIEQKRIQLMKEASTEDQKSETLTNEINELEIKMAALAENYENMIQTIYDQYDLTKEELSKKFKGKKIDVRQEKEELSKFQQEISTLGTVNFLALEELDTIKSLEKHNLAQLEDILKAKKQILKAMEETNKKSEKMFLDTFYKIEKNFSIIFKKLFEGGNTSLKLQSPEKPLESGIEIKIQPPGKKAISLRLLSGGEKALTAIALMFAVYMVRSSPVCVLDEIDAPLDDQNVLRFLNLLKEFQSKTQFVLITHNKKTMSRSGALFGVTMEQPGVSKILGVSLKP